MKTKAIKAIQDMRHNEELSILINGNPATISCLVTDAGTIYGVCAAGYPSGQYNLQIEEKHVFLYDLAFGLVISARVPFNKILFIKKEAVNA